MKDFRDLQVWRKAHELTLAIYPATRAFPDDERFGETSQIRRAAASIPGNIAEGCGGRSDAELAHFLGIAMRSASEVEYRLLLARDLEWLDAATHDRLHEAVTEVKRMLAAFIKRLESSSG